MPSSVADISGGAPSWREDARTDGLVTGWTAAPAPSWYCSAYLVPSRCILSLLGASGRYSAHRVAVRRILALFKVSFSPDCGVTEKVGDDNLGPSSPEAPRGPRTTPSCQLHPSCACAGGGPQRPGPRNRRTFTPSPLGPGPGQAGLPSGLARRSERYRVTSPRPWPRADPLVRRALWPRRLRLRHDALRTKMNSILHCSPASSKS